MKIVFFLILAFPSSGTATIPAHYRDYDTCMAAGQDARDNATRQVEITFTCVPAEPNLEIE